MIRLRTETREQHEALERTLPLGGASLSRAVYAQTLGAFQGFYRTWEAKALACAPARLRPVVEARRKLPLLEADLALVGTLAGQRLPATLDPDWLPGLETEASLLGSMYVVEGSTLGGQVISRQLERELGMAGGYGYSFFLSYGQAVGQQWREFRTLVEAAPERDAESIVASARQTFAAFHRWFTEELAPCPS